MANQHPYSHLEGYANGNHDVLWNEIENFLDTPLKVPNQDSQIKTSRDPVVIEDRARKTNWQEWANQLIKLNDGTLDSDWGDLLLPGNLPESELNVCFSIPFPIIVIWCLMLSDVNLKIVSIFFIFGVLCLVVSLFFFYFHNLLLFCFLFSSCSLVRYQM